jgi:hypothetical protein
VGSRKSAGSICLGFCLEFRARETFSRSCAISNSKKKFLLQLSHLVEAQLVATPELPGTPSTSKSKSKSSRNLNCMP